MMFVYSSIGRPNTYCSSDLEQISPFVSFPAGKLALILLLYIKCFEI